MRRSLALVALVACGGGDHGSDAPVTGDASTCTVGVPADPLTVATTQGLVVGRPAAATIAFLGIPYAAPPVGELRWRPAEPHACWDGVVHATVAGSECSQRGPTGAAAGSEDCLFANVWTPAVDHAARPVLVFIHGGANILGASVQDTGLGNTYDGAVLAARENAVVVTVNYRLGVFGFLAHPLFAAEDAHGSSGNYAITDLVQALGWVRDNIARFGGDPSHVMVFGESAGGFNTCALVATPAASGLFASALIESGGCPSIAKADAEQRGAAFATKLGCSTAACLRQIAATDITAASPTFSELDANALPAAVVDGYLFSDTLLHLIASGQHAKVPFAIGTNQDELGLFLTKPPVFCTDYEADVQTGFGALAAQVLQHYPCLAYPSPKAAEIAAESDAVFTCPTRRIARAMAATQSEPVYRYLFTRPTSPLLGGAIHTAELPYVFATFAAWGSVAGPAEVGLAAEIEDLWGALARTGVMPGWPRQAAGDPTLVLDVPTTTANDPHGANCDFWDSVTP